MDETLRKEVRLLTTRLGAIAREQGGEALFRSIEQLRRLSKSVRQNQDPALMEQARRAAARLGPRRAAEVAHAFSLFFHLVNLSEERQRVRRLRQYARTASGAPMSLRHTFSDLARAGVRERSIAKLLRSMRIEPVLTAHPTEAKRRSIFNHILRLGRALDTLDSLGAASPEFFRDSIDPWIEALWLTDEVRDRPVTPQLEIESALVFLERTIYDLGGNFWDQFRLEAARAFPRLRPAKPFLAFGSWVGADRDGNPHVTPRVSLEAAARLRRSILDYYERYLTRLLSVVSFPCSRPSIVRVLARDLAEAQRRWPSTRAFERLDQPNEYYRRKIRVMLWRLRLARSLAEEGYETPAQFLSDLRLLERLLTAHPSPRVARLGPGRLAAVVEIFGFHAASLDFRQHCSLVRAAAGALIEAYGLPAADEASRIASIRSLLRRRPRPGRWPAAARPVLEEFKTLAEIQKRYGEPAAHRYVLSMTERASDVWNALLLGWQAGLLKPGRAGRFECSFDVVPLFETLADLAAGPAILDGLLADVTYRAVLDARGNFEEVMLGYSDSVKDGGYLAANWALARAQKQLARVAEHRGVELGLFHGKGGAIDRGGGQSHRSVQSQPDAAPGGRIRITEQGEVVSLKYANFDIAERNLEQLATSVLDGRLRRRDAANGRDLARWETWAEEMAARSRDFYRNLVYETPGFLEFFRQATPIDLIGQLRLGSRPARRSPAGALGALRAIPWVFAWTQSRHLLPAWYGLGYALEEFSAAHSPDGLAHLRQMYRHWPFFQLLVDNAATSLAKTDLYIARQYERLVEPASLRRAIAARIEEEYHRSVRMTLAVTGSSRLLEHHPVLDESIRLRNPYVDPLNLLQIRFLAAWRRSLRSRPDLLRVLQITIGGVAFGMKSTG